MSLSNPAREKYVKFATVNNLTYFLYDAKLFNALPIEIYNSATLERILHIKADSNITY